MSNALYRLTPDQRAFYDEHGYLIIEDAMEEIGLRAVQVAYERTEAELKPAWEQSIRDGTYTGGYGNGPNAHTMRPDFKQESIFLELAGNPRIIPVVEELIGPDYQVMEIVCHNHHAGAAAHTGWHRDWPPYIHPTRTLKAKVFYFLDEQDADMGCFSLVPGTHTVADGPPKQRYVDTTLEEMPDLKKIVGPAGSAVIWNVLCWHTGLANTSTRDRRIVIYGYMPFFIKKWVSHAPPPEIIEWADTPQKRQLMGIHSLNSRRGWDRTDVPYLPGCEEIANARKF